MRPSWSLRPANCGKGPAAAASSRRTSSTSRVRQQGSCGSRSSARWLPASGRSPRSQAFLQRCDGIRRPHMLGSPEGAPSGRAPFPDGGGPRTGTARRASLRRRQGRRRRRRRGASAGRQSVRPRPCGGAARRRLRGLGDAVPRGRLASLMALVTARARAALAQDPSADEAPGRPEPGWVRRCA